MEVMLDRPAPAVDEIVEEAEDFVEAVRQATGCAYDLLRGRAGSEEDLARALPEDAVRLLRMGGSRLAGLVADALLADGEPEADGFARGARLGFAAGCLAQWRVLEYLIGEELPLWPLQTASAERQVD